MTQDKKPMPIGIRLLLVFSGLFVLALLIGTVAMIGAAAWAILPGPQIDTRHAIGEDSLAVFHVHDPGHDPHLRALGTTVFRDALEAGQKKNPNQAPLSDWQIEQLTKPMELVTWIAIPRQLTLVVDSPPEADDHTWTLLVNPTAGVRWMELMMSRDAARNDRLVHADGRDFIRSKDQIYSFDGGTVIWSNTLPQSKAIHQRVDARTQSPMAQQVTELSKDWSLAAIIKDTGLLMRFAGIRDAPKEMEEAISEELTEARAGIRMSDADTAEVQLHIEKASRESAELLAASADDLCESLGAKVAQTRIRFSCTHQLAGDTLELNIRYQNLQAFIAARMDPSRRDTAQPDAAPTP